MICHNLLYDLHNIFGVHIPFNVAARGGVAFFGKWCVEEKWIKVKLKSGKVVDKLQKRYVTFADTGRHFTGWSVKQLGKWVGFDKIDIGETHPEDLPDDEMVSYCDRDAVIVFLAASQLQETYLELGTSYRLTIGGSALELWRRRFQPLLNVDGHSGYIGLPDENLEELAQAFYGGRTEAFWYGDLPEEDGPYYYGDFRSMYPSVMAELELPWPDRNHCDLIQDPPLSVLQEAGASQVTVEVPSQMYPPLPHRAESGKLTFPVGRFTGWWTHNELQYAIRQCGVRAIQVHRSYFYHRTVRAFEGYSVLCYALRQRGGAYGTVGKLLGNGCFGKFGQTNPSGEMMPYQDYQASTDKWDEENLDRIRMICELQGMDGKTIANKIQEERMKALPIVTGYYPSETDPITVTVESGEFTYPIHTNIIWSAYITAGARIKLHQAILRYRALYCDTDSVVTTLPIPSSDRLGDLNYEKLWKQGFIGGPKNYSYLTHEGGSDAKVKGVPRRKGYVLENGKWRECRDLPRTAQEGKTVAFLTPAKFKELFIKKAERFVRPVANCDPEDILWEPVPKRENVWHRKTKILRPRVDKRAGEINGGWSLPLEVFE